MDPLNESAKVVLSRCMKLKSHESCLIITDKNKARIANAFLGEAKKITSKCQIIQIPVGKVNGEEPPKETAEKMKEYDVIIMPVTKSLSWTKAREEATKEGARIASMPSITEDIMKRTLNIAYENLKKKTENLYHRLKGTREIEIKTKAGTDLKLSVEKSEWLGLDAGVYDKPGKWGNLPSGEIFCAPIEGSANGIFVVDASMAGVGKLDNPILITVKDGFAVKIEGSSEAKKLKRTLEKVKSRKAYNIAEIGIGTNYKAKVTGNVLEDEKVAGTCHIALGNNALFGGTTDVPIHLDGVMKKPTIKADGKIIIADGEFF